MPVLEATEFSTPRSALRHRPIGEDGTKPGKRASGTSASTPPLAVKRASRQRPHTADADGEVDEWQRAEDDPSAKSSRQAQGPAPARRASATTGANTLPRPPRPTTTAPKRALKRRAHPLLYLGLGMIAMLVLWTGLMGMTNWFNTTMDDIHFGRPRTFQIDQFVGHNESSGIPSHFITINLRGHLAIMEFPGGDASHARIFLGPQLSTDGSDLVPVTLKFFDVNGDHRSDMIVMFQNAQVVFINDQGTFRPLRPEERHQVEDVLQRHGQ